MFCPAKETIKRQIKKTLRMGVNSCKQSNWQEINLQNIQTAHTALCQKNKQPNPKKKRAEYLSWPFSKEHMQIAKTTWKDAQHH